MVNQSSGYVITVGPLFTLLSHTHIHESPEPGPFHVKWNPAKTFNCNLLVDQPVHVGLKEDLLHSDHLMLTQVQPLIILGVVICFREDIGEVILLYGLILTERRGQTGLQGPPYTCALTEAAFSFWSHEWLRQTILPGALNVEWLTQTSLPGALYGSHKLICLVS